MKNVIILSGLIIASLLTGCGGSKILRKPVAVDTQATLVADSDSTISADLDWVIVRDGPGTWAKNADWDEYLIRVRNLSDNDITVQSIVVYDSLETKVSSSDSRKNLIRGTKATSRRYKDHDIDVKAGFGVIGLAAVGGATYLTGGAVIAASWGAGATTISAVGVTAVGAVVAAPVLVVGGVFRGVNNAKVTNRIEDRHTLLPLNITAHTETALDIFFPLSPSPQRVEIHYADASGNHIMALDTSIALHGLHLGGVEDEVMMAQGADR